MCFIWGFSSLWRKTMARTDTWGPDLCNLQGRLQPKAADVSGRLLGAKGASFGSHGRWSWDILPLLAPSKQTHDCPPHSPGNSARLTPKGQRDAAEGLKWFMVRLLSYRELDIVIAEPSFCFRWGRVMHQRDSHSPHNASPTQCFFWNAHKSWVRPSSDMSLFIISSSAVKHKERSCMSRCSKDVWFALRWVHIRTPPPPKKKSHFLSQSVLF